MAYEVIISNEVFTALNSIVFYLETKWSQPVAENFLEIFYKKVELLAINPDIGRKSFKDPSIRKILLTKHNLLYYQFIGGRVELLTIFFTVQNPDKNQFD